MRSFFSDTKLISGRQRETDGGSGAGRKKYVSKGNKPAFVEGGELGVLLTCQSRELRRDNGNMQKMAIRKRVRATNGEKRARRASKILCCY